jgi:putative glycerol-1-phosphate prenyltransferase
MFVGSQEDLTKMSKSVSELFLDVKMSGSKELAVLIDPDTPDKDALAKVADSVESAGVKIILFGGSLLTQFELDEKIDFLKNRTSAKVITYPSSAQQISAKADAILFLSLISGRNPELLIGQQVIAAPLIKRLGLEAISTGYMLVDGGRPTTASYMSGSMPIPRDKPEIAACTAMAGEMLGMKNIYMDAGSGAQEAISSSMISTVRNSVNLPILVGGGIRTEDAAVSACEAGADIIVVGNAIEKNPLLVKELVSAIK